MTTIVTRSGKGSPLTHVEVDTNFTNLNTNKLEAGAIALGSAATPSISFTGDTNTGIYSPGEDQLAVATNGTQRATIDSSGRLLVGTSTARTNASEISTIDGNIALVNDDTYSTSLTRIIHYYSSTNSYGVQPVASINFNTTGDAQSSITFTTRSSPGDFTERARIDSSGRLGIGTTSPSGKLTVVGGTTSSSTVVVTDLANYTLELGRSRDNTGSFGYIGGTSGTGLTLGSNDLERVRIDTSGRVLVGTSTARAVGTYGEQHPLQLEANNAGNWPAINITWNRSSDGFGPRFNFGRSRSASNGGVTVVQNDDSLGSFHFYGADGTDLLSEAASIGCAVDGTPGSNDMPGRIVLSTTADGAASPTEAMRINSQQELLVGTATRNANGGVLQLKSGITFPATAVAASDANTLDDYEEGTWTPTQGGGTTVVGAFSSVGSYTKVGKIVSYAGYMYGATSIAFDPVGGSLAGGLPFPVTSGFNSAGNAQNSTVSVFIIATAGGVAIYGASAIAATGTISFAGTYITN